MHLFRKKSEVIKAIQWTGENIFEVMEFMLPQAPIYMAGFSNRDDIVGISTSEGVIVANKGDWIITGVKGETYPCNADIFEETYEPAD